MKERGETYNQSKNSSDDGDDNVDLASRPKPVQRGVDRFDYLGNALGRHPRAEDDDGGAEYKDNRGGPKQEHGSRRMGQGPLGAAGESEKGKV